ncbi:MAG: response regulator with CheY-like receiver, AAA-type ATPase, and DNA-binding domain [bacterium P3]|nr:MAG: response regulator with CheY-like receiver, AAA-type ATPase, and DNA-binding domain [bacterium P3]KWW40942.1 MAG: response regulator with CheY-like receiver, AAA-type ATPase, and DNA-binding domain [bacterium F083]
MKILWADDEIDLLKPHILFLQERGYEVIPVTSGNDALDVMKEEQVDLVFLDEHMPGMGGLDALSAIKEIHPTLPVVMITKSEEEHIMEEALGGKISDYLIKPVNPKQILLTIKKHTEARRLVSERSMMSYQQEFREIGMRLMEPMDHADWTEMYKRLVYWEIELSETEDENIHGIFESQKAEANAQFCRFYERNYMDWLKGLTAKPTMSPTVLRERLMPMLGADRPTFLIVVDNFRYDQWKYLQPLFEQMFRVETDSLFYSIVPTTTQFARNAMFSGLMPSEIERKYPQYWVNEDEEGYKNQFESELLGENLRRNGIGIRHSYNKVLNAQYGWKLVEGVNKLMHNALNVVVFNFIDMLSHARTDSNIVRELAADERSYRSVTRSWFVHSPLAELLKELAAREVNVVVTTDHGSVRVDNPVRVRGDRDMSVNLRYKQGRLLEYDVKEVFEVKDPASIYLPKRHITSPYIFARNNDFFAYPNNFNQYVQYYHSTFQHGGISMEEVLIPWVVLRGRTQAQ